jgi:multidrug efflux pump subunit AcrA (membrane-fusion protein)
MAVLFKIGFVVLLIAAVFFVILAITMQSQLKQARNESVQLQSQLTQARDEMGKAQASAQELSGEATKLQAQLEQAKGELANAKANAEKASGEIARLQAQLERAKSEAADARANAEKASGELARLRVQPQAQPQAQPKPIVVEPAPITPTAASSKEMPLSVSFRNAIVGDGKAVVLQNTSSDTLLVNVKFTDPTATTHQVYHLVLDGGAIKELGSLGAWKLGSGDRIEIESADYAPIVKTAP